MSQFHVIALQSSWARILRTSWGWSILTTSQRAKFCLILTCGVLALLLTLAAGCGGPKTTAAGTYRFSPRPEFYIELKNNGQYRLGTDRSEEPEWISGWPIGIGTVVPGQEGQWVVEEKTKVLLRSSGTEIPFGVLRDDEIIDLIGSIWSKE
jgi:hypothetical protein